MERAQALDSNPSSFSKRVGVFVLALIGFAIAARLAAYQLRLAPPPPDPLFGGGSERVLNSPLSQMLPVPDAALGALAYAVEAVLVVIGKSDRYLATPFVVLAYTSVALLMALTSIGLTVYQLAALHTGCALCLVSALLSVLLVFPAALEGRAALHHALRH